MKHLSRDAWLAMALFAILVVLTLAAAGQQTQEQAPPPLASFSSDPNGALALKLWLEEIGYPVDDRLLTFFQIPEGTGLVLMLEPFAGVTSAEWEILDAWVEEGGALLIAGEGGGVLLAARHYDFALRYLPEPAPALLPQTPLFTSPALSEPAPVRARAYFESERRDFLTHLAVVEGPVMVSIRLGRGRVVLCGTSFPFSNAGLKEPGNGAVALNAIAAAGRSGQVWFDEWHHGRRADQFEIVGPGNWLRYTPAGHGLLYAGLVIFVALALSGRRFGRPTPLAGEMTRRAPLEHITALANLSRRAGHRSAVLGQYKHQLKRDLGRRYRLDPTLPDDVYAAELARLNPNLDAAKLGRLLARLSQGQADEKEMIEIAAEVAHWLKEP